MEKILFLGGAPSQIPAIKYAKKRGYYVITADYLPNNPGHKFSDEYFNISTIEKENILRLAERSKIDAVSSYASDPSALTASYVSDKLDLIGNSYLTVEILSQKNLFRKFLLFNGFNVPWNISSVSVEDILDRYNGQKAILKPIDSSGSKGVFIIYNKEDIIKYFNISKKFSRSGEIILEEYIEREGPQIHGEGFVINGDVKFILLGDQYFSEINKVAPYSTLIPSVYHKDIIEKVIKIVKLALQKVKFNTGGINIEVIVGKDQKIYIIEIGPRNGGNFMPQLIKYSTGIDLVKANIDVLFRKETPFIFKLKKNKCFAQVILHANKNGYLNKINIPEIFSNFLVEKNIFYKKGDIVFKYKNSNDVIGVIILCLSDITFYKKYLNYIYNWNWVDVSDLNIEIIQEKKDYRQINKYLGFNKKIFNPPMEERLDLLIYSKKLAKHSIQFWVYVNNEVAGFMACYFNDETNKIGFISTISIIKKYQKLGLGNQLLNSAFLFGRKFNFYKIRLEVHTKNDVVDFYKQHLFYEIMSSENKIILEKAIIKEELNNVD